MTDSVTYRITPLDADGNDCGHPPVIGTGQVSMETEYDYAPDAEHPIRLNLTVDGQPSTQWNMQDYGFEMWPTLAVSGCHDVEKAEERNPTHGWVLARHLRNVQARDDGRKLTIVIPHDGAFFRIADRADAPKD